MRFPKIEGPIISVCYRGSSYHGDRESYFIRTSDLGPTAFYTRAGEDDANSEFTAAFYTPAAAAAASRQDAENTDRSLPRSLPKDRNKNIRSVKFQSLQRDYHAQQV